jgi:hypothetical protein
MKVTVSEKEQKEITYPCLMQSKYNELIVLFHSEGRGMVVRPNKDFNESSDIRGWNMDNFKPFHGTITLQND